MFLEFDNRRHRSSLIILDLIQHSLSDAVLCRLLHDFLILRFHLMSFISLTFHSLLKFFNNCCVMAHPKTKRISCLKYLLVLFQSFRFAFADNMLKLLFSPKLLLLLFFDVLVEHACLLVYINLLPFQFVNKKGVT